MSEKILNIGILAHADAGKTTITENLLQLSGVIKSAGSVDKGTSFTDFEQVEKDRGISIKSSYVSFNWNNIKINLIDTPGHVDFSADVERNIRVMDAAILILSAVEGVQAHTETLWTALKEQSIPVFIIINKIDRVGADFQRVLDEIHRELTKNTICLQSLQNEASSNVSIEWKEHEALVEDLANFDDEILENFLEGKQTHPVKLKKHLLHLAENLQITPVFLASAKNEIGISDFMDYISLIDTKQYNADEKLSALVFGISHDKTMGKVAHVKVFSGKIENRQTLKIHGTSFDEKVVQVRKNAGKAFEDIGIIEAGDIAGLCGLKSVKIGDIIGEPSQQIPMEQSLRTPLLTVQVKAKNSNDYAKLAEALQTLNTEDPSLDFNWLKEDQEMHIKIMGWIQIEILERILHDRFSIEAAFEDPTVIYKETPARQGEGFVKYWMPKPCWAILKFKIEPGERGSGVQYQSKVSVDKIHQKYQNEVERTIPEALKQGIKGWEVTDIIITLIDGENHEIHSRPGDFVIATPMGIMQGLNDIGTNFLEPVISFKIHAPEELLGAIAGDITQMRGSFESPQILDGRFSMQGLLPLSTSIDFPVRLSSRSGGKAKISTQFHSYQLCNDEYGVSRPYKGISPLDTSKYILKARKAIQ